MNIKSLAIPEVRILQPRRFDDERGFFSETWNRRTLRDAGVELDFVQDNHSLSRAQGTVRGLHYQAPPFAQDKLVRVVRGRILDVAVDLRRGSPSYGRHVSAEIGADQGHQILVPQGFAHGFCTLEPDTEVIYKVTGYFSPQHDLGILWNDPELEISWPVETNAAVLSEKDLRQPRLREIESPFNYPS